MHPPSPHVLRCYWLAVNLSAPCRLKKIFPNPGPGWILIWKIKKNTVFSAYSPQSARPVLLTKKATITRMLQPPKKQRACGTDCSSSQPALPADLTTKNMLPRGVMRKQPVAENLPADLTTKNMLPRGVMRKRPVAKNLPADLTTKNTLPRGVMRKRPVAKNLSADLTTKNTLPGPLNAPFPYGRKQPDTPSRTQQHRKLSACRSSISPPSVLTPSVPICTHSASPSAPISTRYMPMSFPETATDSLARRKR